MASAAFFESVKQQVESCQGCADLQKVSQQCLSALAAQSDAISKQVDKLAPLKDLLDPPTTPDDVVNWVKGLIDNVIKPLYEPVNTLVVQQAELVTSTAEIVSAIQSKAASFADCAITTPETPV